MPGERITPEEFFARFPRPNANEAVVPAITNNPHNPNPPVAFSTLPPISTRMVYETTSQDFTQSQQILPLLLVGLSVVCVSVISIVAIFALTKR